MRERERERRWERDVERGSGGVRFRIKMKA
jgi:hypothetical protein